MKMKNKNKTRKTIRRALALFMAFVVVLVGGTLLLATHNFAEAYADCIMSDIPDVAYETLNS